MQAKLEQEFQTAYATSPARFKPYPFPVIERGKLLEIVV